jgi:hypothetical protein
MSNGVEVLRPTKTLERKNAKAKAMYLRFVHDLIFESTSVIQHRHPRLVPKVLSNACPSNVIHFIDIFRQQMLIKSPIDSQNSLLENVCYVQSTNYVQ